MNKALLGLLLGFSMAGCGEAGPPLSVSQVQVVTAMLDDGLDPQAALDRPRFCIRDGTASGALTIEDGIASDVVDTLRARGHELTVATGWQRIGFGRGQIIRRDSNGALWAGSDGRADGVAMTL